MAVRIPGPQATAGLDALYLDPDPVWMPGPNGSAAGILAPFAAAAQDLADRGTGPIQDHLSDTGQLETDQNLLADETQIHVDQAAADTGQVDPLRQDHLSPQFGPISGDVAASGDHLGTSGSAPTVPGPTDPPEGPWNQPGGGGPNV